ncbi:hypothetical protein PR202_gb01731 [Eleusine coracana subsp. coracana]|uniref:Uncharacterized protein n=1 Tax=Eleusine coracana subsp. coracana TaxID=191504 RepID=A0AAV5DUX4_ELECO|nr:hypothetical protein PR202_gb01731 [Eleusine coracana subsp. coracana]
MASSSLHPPALLPPLCCSCSSQAFLDPRRTRGPPPRFSNGTCYTARPFGRSEFLGKGGLLTSRTVARRRLRLGVAGAGRGPFFGGGGRRMNRGTSRVVGNLAFAALLTYLAVTGQLRWVLDAIVSLWVREFLLLKMGREWLNF